MIIKFFRILETNNGIEVIRSAPEWFGSLPEGLQDALISSGWPAERILSEKLSAMPSSILCLVNNYGCSISFNQDGLVSVQSVIPAWWENMPLELKDWTVQNAMNFRLLSASKVEILKYAAENWSSTDRLAEFPIQLIDELENWTLFSKMVKKYLYKQIAEEKAELEKEDLLNFNNYPTGLCLYS